MQNQVVRRLLAVPLAAFALVTIACRERPAQRPAIDPQTQDVAPPSDAALSTADDPQGHQVTSSFSGVLPGDYPKDAPPYIPSTLVDFGERWVEFQTPDPLVAVRTAFTQSLRGRGWAEDGASFTKNGRALRVSFESANPGTKIRVEY